METTVKTKLDKLTRKLRSIKAKDIMTKDVTTTTEKTPLADIAELMTRERISGLPVMGKKGTVVGIITTTDLFLVMDIIKAGDVVENGDIAATHPTVKFTMTSDYVRIEHMTSLDEIIGTMRCKNVHTLPVFEGDKLVGVIGRRDVLKNFYSAVKAAFS